jgi:hypothetical protein
MGGLGNDTGPQQRKTCAAASAVELGTLPWRVLEAVVVLKYFRQIFCVLNVVNPITDQVLIWFP